MNVFHLNSYFVLNFNKIICFPS